MTSAERNCGKGKQGPIPFACKLGYGHEGKCSPYTLPPPTREQWAALDPANRYRACVNLDDGTVAHAIYRTDRTEAAAELGQFLEGMTEMRERHPYMAQVTGGYIEDRGDAR